MRENLKLIAGIAILLAIPAVIIAQCAAPVSGPCARFAERMGANPGDCECAWVDTDGDGYKSCTIHRESGPVSIECHGIFRWCRAPKARALQ